MTPYQYAANSPINFIDINGDSLQFLGTQEEVDKLIGAIQTASGSTLQYTSQTNEETGAVTVNITGFESVDDNFSTEQGYLSELIGHESFTTVKFDAEAGIYGGGSYDPETQTVKLDPDHLTDRNSFHYWNVSERNDWLGKYLGKTESNFAYFRAWDTMAHELFGHGVDQIRGKGRNEPRAIYRANQVRKKHGKLIRNADQPSVLW